MAERAQILVTAKDQTAAAFSSVQQHVKGVTSTLQSLAPQIAAVFSIAGVVAFAKSAINAGDRMHDLSQRTGIAVESLSKWKFIAEQSGATLESIQPGLKGLAKNLEDAARGGKDSSDAFARLGVSVKDQSGQLRGLDTVMLDLAEKFASMENGPHKTALALRVFGKAGEELIPTLNLGKAGIADLMTTAERLGIVMSTQAAAAADELNDSLNGIKQAGTALVTQLLNHTAPAISQVAQAMADAARDGGIFAAAIAGYGEAWKAWLGGAGSDAVRQQRILVSGLQQEIELLEKALEMRRKSASVIGPDPAELQRKLDAAILTRRSALAVLERLEQQAQKPIKAPAVGVVPTGDLEDPQKKRRAAEALEKQLYELMTASDILWERDRDNTMAAMELHRKSDEERLRSLNEMIVESDILWERDRDATIANNLKKLASDKETRDSLYAGLFNEREALRAHYEADFDALNDLNARKAISNEEYYGLMQRLLQKHTKDQTALIMSSGTKQEKFAAMTQGKQAEFLIDSLVNQTAGVAQYSRKMFEINKIAGIANVAMKMPEAIADAFAFGTKFGGPVLGGIMAGITGAAMMVQMEAIRSATFGGGGGSAPSLAGGTPALPVSPVSSGAPAGSGQTTIINFQGGTESERKMIRRFAEMLNENSRDGGRLIIA